MRRLMLALALVAATASAARADDTRVRTSASVEVLDDKAQVDDVISRLRQQQQQQQAASTESAAKAQAGALKLERPPAPSSGGDASHRAVGPEPKEQRPGSRRTSRDRTANPDRTLAPHLHRR